MAQVDKCSRNVVLYYCVIHKLGFHIHSFVLEEHLRLNLQIFCIISSSNVFGSVLDLFLDLYRSVYVQRLFPSSNSVHIRTKMRCYRLLPKSNDFS